MTSSNKLFKSSGHSKKHKMLARTTVIEGQVGWSAKVLKSNVSGLIISKEKSHYLVLDEAKGRPVMVSKNDANLIMKAPFTPMMNLAPAIRTVEEFITKNQGAEISNTQLVAMLVNKSYPVSVALSAVYEVLGTADKGISSAIASGAKKLGRAASDAGKLLGRGDMIMPPNPAGSDDDEEKDKADNPATMDDSGSYNPVAGKKRVDAEASKRERLGEGVKPTENDKEKSASKEIIQALYELLGENPHIDKRLAMQDLINMGFSPSEAQEAVSQYNVFQKASYTCPECGSSKVETDEAHGKRECKTCGNTWSSHDVERSAKVVEEDDEKSGTEGSEQASERYKWPKENKKHSANKGVADAVREALVTGTNQAIGSPLIHANPSPKKPKTPVEKKPKEPTAGASTPIKPKTMADSIKEAVTIPVFEVQQKLVRAVNNSARVYYNSMQPYEKANYLDALGFNGQLLAKTEYNKLPENVQDTIDKAFGNTTANKADDREVYTMLTEFVEGANNPSKDAWIQYAFEHAKVDTKQASAVWDKYQ